MMAISALSWLPKAATCGERRITENLLPAAKQGSQQQH
jgi:hypothetical protein